MGMIIINLTPHVITIDGCDFRPSNVVARCVETTEPAGDMTSYNKTVIPLIKRQLGEVEGLAEPDPNIFYVVSALVRLALPERTDIGSPGDLVRDDDENIIGCENLVVNR